jgi:SAM-dependent methyltransferase
MEQVAERVYGTNVNQAVLDNVCAAHQIILDVGCGAGSHAEILTASGRIVDGITLSPEEARMASSCCRKVLIHDLEQGLPASLTGPYDLCLCSHVIEHLRDPSPLLEGMRRVLAPYGSLLVALPNLLQYKHRWQLLRGRFEYQSGGIMDSTHVHWYTWDTGRRLLESHGFAVEKQLADGGFPLSKMRSLLAMSVTRRLDQMALRHFPGLFGWQHIYLARKK